MLEPIKGGRHEKGRFKYLWRIINMIYGRKIDFISYFYFSVSQRKSTVNPLSSTETNWKGMLIASPNAETFSISANFLPTVDHSEPVKYATAENKSLEVSPVDPYLNFTIIVTSKLRHEMEFVIRFKNIKV